MKILRILGRIRWNSFLSLVRISLPNFLLLWPTYRATKDCMRISTQYFERKHYQNGPPNAFRHALWNILIAKYSYSFSSTLEKALDWAKEITDWHEEAFFSKPLPMAMDFHNNTVGRWLFSENFNWSNEQFIEKLLLLTQKAVKINKDSPIDQYKNQLVYISDEH